MPLINSSLFVGLASLHMNYFSSCQRFSMGFISGDSAGVRHQLILDLTKNLVQPSMYLSDRCLA